MYTYLIIVQGAFKVSSAILLKPNMLSQNVLYEIKCTVTNSGTTGTSKLTVLGNDAPSGG